MRPCRIVLSTGLTLAVLTTCLALEAQAAPRYRGTLDITFPVGAPARFSNDYNDPRAGHVHRATDLFARGGSVVRAAKAGRVVWLPRTEQPGAGYAVWIRNRRGVTFAYYHLGPSGGSLRQAVARGLQLGDHVRRGAVIGRVGDSGNAAGGSAHLHLEIHDPRITDPWGGDRRDPYPSLRRAQQNGHRRVRAAASRSAAGTAGSSSGSSIRSGSRGPLVARWQHDLNRAVRAGLVADGIFGPATRAATIRFQRSAGLGGPHLGVVGPRSRAAMQRRLSGLDRPAQAAQATTTALLHVGSRGRNVAVWQRQLNRAQRAGLVVDGMFGPATHAATVRFQRSASLGPSGLGYVGPRTRAAMARRLR